MVCAIYARKSTTQTADADVRSVTRQIEHARTFARAKGWDVPDSLIFSDDAVSGAETKKLINRPRLLDALRESPPPFQVLIMRDASRFSRRDGDEAFGELKRIAQAGIQIYFYSDGTRFAFGTFGDNVVGFVRAEMAAEYRRQVAQWTTEAMLRKAHLGHICGSKLFGYTNVRIDGHVDRRIAEAEATVIRRIFALCADGMGYTRIAKTLNAERALTPTPTQHRSASWSPSSVREVLHREAYCGTLIYNRTRDRAPDGTRIYVTRPESEWVRHDRPDLRIVFEEAWTAAHTRLASIRAALQTTGWRDRRRRRDSNSAYLLSGFTRCAVCGGSIGVLDRRQYGCIAYHKRGTTVCGNAIKLPIPALDDAVLRRLRADALRPQAVMAIIEGLRKRFASPTLGRDLKRHRHEPQELDREIVRLTEAVAQTDQMPPLLDALRTRHARRVAVAATITALEANEVRPVEWTAVARKVRLCSMIGTPA